MCPEITVKSWVATAVSQVGEVVGITGNGITTRLLAAEVPFRAFVVG